MTRLNVSAAEIAVETPTVNKVTGLDFPVVGPGLYRSAGIADIEPRPQWLELECQSKTPRRGERLGVHASSKQGRPKRVGTHRGMGIRARAVLRLAAESRVLPLLFGPMPLHLGMRRVR